MEPMFLSCYWWTKRGLGAARFLSRVDRYAKNLCRANKDSPRIYILSLCMEKAESSQSPVKTNEASVITSSSTLIHKEVLPPLFFRFKYFQHIAAFFNDVRLSRKSIYISKIPLKHFFTFRASKSLNMESNRRRTVSRPHCAQDWEARKALIIEVYGRMGLESLMKLMEEEYSFKATYVLVLSPLGIHMLRDWG